MLTFKERLLACSFAGNQPMAPQIDSHTAPQLCRWLQFKELPVLQPSDGTYAICVRLCEHPRQVVPRADCVGCPYWDLFT
jgi:hypothetical protein